MQFLILLLLVFISTQSYADTLVILNKSEASASLVDLDSLEVVASLKTGIGPHEVTISTDGKIAVVSNYGDSKPGSTLTVIDIPSATVSSTIDLEKFVRPHGISWIKGTKQVLVTSEELKSVIRVDVIEKKIVNVIPTVQDISHMLVLDSLSSKAFVSNIGSGSVSVLDLKKNSKINDTQTGKGAEGIDINLKTNEIWVTNRGANNISVIDAKSMKIKTTLKSESFPIRIKFTSDENYALVTNAQTGNLNVFDARTKKILTAIDFPKGRGDTAGRMFGNQFKDSSVPIGIAIDPRKNRAFVAHANLDEISIIDLEKFKLIGKFHAGKEPDGMAYSKLSINKRR